MLLEEVVSSTRVSEEVFGFHCQQAVEKLLKALLAALGTRFGRTHDIGHLIDLLGDGGHVLPTAASDLDRLTPYGTVFRYEDQPEDAEVRRRETLDAIRTLRAHVEKVLAEMSPKTKSRPGSA